MILRSLSVYYNLFSNVCGVCVQRNFHHQTTTLVFYVEKLENSRMQQKNISSKGDGLRRGCIFYDKLISETRNIYKHSRLLIHMQFR